MDNFFNECINSIQTSRQSCYTDSSLAAAAPAAATNGAKRIYMKSLMVCLRSESSATSLAD